MLESLKNFDGMNITINTNEDCNLACKYDVLKGTKVLMADFTEKNIELVKAGDKIIGVDEFKDVSGNRNFVVAEVLSCGKTRDLKYIYQIVPADEITGEKADSLFISAEHPVLNEKGEWQKTSDFYNSQKDDWLISQDKNIEKRVYRVDNELSSVDEMTASPFIARIYEDDTMPNNSDSFEMYNMHTSCHTFIANGIIVHNCYEIEKHHKVIPIEYAKKFIDKILEDPDPIGSEGTEDAWITHTGLIIDFIGGDSLMHPEIVDSILSYFVYKATLLNHKYATNWRASISSNGTLFMNKPVRDLIAKWGPNISIGISIDGCPEIHDMNRIYAERDANGKERGSMPTILEWWPWVKKNMPESARQTKATCARDSIPYLYKSLVFMHETLGLTYINQNFIMEDTGCTEDDYIELDHQFELCEKYLLAHRHEMYWSMFDQQGLDRPSDDKAEHEIAIDKGWCGSGAMPTVGMTGKIYPCFRWLPHTMSQYQQQADSHCVGTVFDGFNHKDRFREVKENTRRKISSKYCLECEYEHGCPYCIGGCFCEYNKFKRTEHICTISKLRNKWSKIYWDQFEELEHLKNKFFNPYKDSEGHIKSAWTDSLASMPIK